MSKTFALSDVIAGPIETIEMPTAEVFERYSSMGTGRPFVVRGAIRGKTFPEHWTEGSWRSAIGDLTVKVWVSASGTFRGGTPPYDLKQQVQINMTVNEFFDRLAGKPLTPYLAPNERYYLFQVPLRDLTEKILADYEPLPVFPKDKPVFPHAWVSGAGVTTQVHYDLAENIYLQVRGRKRVVLWDPGQYGLLYTIPLQESYGTESPIDLRAPDIQKYPDFARSRAVECTLGAGDLLYIPLGWFHYVTTLEQSFSLNHWWVPSFFEAILPAAGMLIGSAPSLRPELRKMLSQMLA